MGRVLGGETSTGEVRYPIICYVSEGFQLIEHRASSHAKQLILLISSFPTTNPTPIDTQDPSSRAPGVNGHSPSPSQTDLVTLLSQIRARYRLLCSALGVRPRLATTHDGRGSADVDVNPLNGQAGGIVEGIEGPMKGVDTKKLLF